MKSVILAILFISNINCSERQKFYRTPDFSFNSYDSDEETFVPSPDTSPTPSNNNTLAQHETLVEAESRCACNSDTRSRIAIVGVGLTTIASFILTMLYTFNCKN